MAETYSDFFRRLTGNPPYPFQRRLGEKNWPDVVDVPTGLGKTAAVVVAWLWRRRQNDPSTGRRLVYCLPMRTLVEQTATAAADWFSKLEAPPAVFRLMGGEASQGWDDDPQAEQLIVGTQDMLLSRALNRGYAMSRYRWPIQFALLGSDCLWVLDETQLMGVGVETSAQLQAFRDQLGTVGPARTVWMSATLGREQLATVDHQEPEGGWSVASLDGEDHDLARVRERTGARKQLARASVSLSSKDAQQYAGAMAEMVAELHSRRRGLTLVIVNRVSRAQAIHAALVDRGVSPVGLVHSRFRPPDRARGQELLFAAGDRVVVATQAVEAGVDVSATTLVSELAPWPSLVQRFGRCNRYGELTDAEIHWIDLSTEKSDNELALPYAPDALDQARQLLGQLQDDGNAGPAAVAKVDFNPAPVVRPVLRRRDLLQLFDTTPDLSGHDVDVSRFVRDSTDTDVHIYWRSPENRDAPPARDELCAVGLASANAFLDELRKRRSAKGKRAVAAEAVRWDPLADAWVSVRRCGPGQTVCLDLAAGGYDEGIGWTGIVAAGRIGEIVPADSPMPSMDGDPDSQRQRWVLLRNHLGHVEAEARRLAEMVAPDWPEELAVAGRWHDVGKAHPSFQEKLTEPVRDEPSLRAPNPGPWAKSSHRRRGHSSRPGLRHELASALAYLAHGPAKHDQQRSLIAYLVAAHHGKVRMSIRSLPFEARPDDPSIPYARGIWQGDQLVDFDMPDGQRLHGVHLDLAPMSLGAGSWSERMLSLRDAPALGPFRLGLLETLVRIADWIASDKEQNGGYDD